MGDPNDGTPTAPAQADGLADRIRRPVAEPPDAGRESIDSRPS
ncbi:hypothetical protein [Saccharopolyspora shandongensis]